MLVEVDVCTNAAVRGLHARDQPAQLARTCNPYFLSVDRCRSRRRATRDDGGARSSRKRSGRRSTARSTRTDLAVGTSRQPKLATVTFDLAPNSHDDGRVLGRQGLPLGDRRRHPPPLPRAEGVSHRGSRSRPTTGCARSGLAGRDVRVVVLMSEAKARLLAVVAAAHATLHRRGRQRVRSESHAASAARRKRRRTRTACTTRYGIATRCRPAATDTLGRSVSACPRRTSTCHSPTRRWCTRAASTPRSRPTAGGSRRSRRTTSLGGQDSILVAIDARAGDGRRACTSGG